MKASELRDYLGKKINELGVDPEVDILLERMPEFRNTTGVSVQYEDPLEDAITSQKYIEGVLDKKSTRIKLLGASFER